MADLEKVLKGLECCKQIDMHYLDVDCWHPTFLECPYHDCEECIKELVTDAYELLKEQKTKTGHWIWLQYCANEGVYCSECHTKMFDRYPVKKKLSQFCGHCGAKMDDEVEGR